jgi:hypothetical protein
MKRRLSAIHKLKGLNVADKLDKLFTEYFSGDIEKQISWRRFELRFDKPKIDENVGGGRKQNEINRSLDNQLIQEESDHEIIELTKRYESVKQFMMTLDPQLVTMLDYHYDTRKSYVWEKVAQMMYKSKSQCLRDLQKAKQDYLDSPWARAVDNLV